MFTRIVDFVSDWRQESALTGKILEAITDGARGHAVSPDDDRTIGLIAWHIVTSIPEMLGRTGLKLKGLDLDATMSTRAADIAAAHKDLAAEVIELVQSQWNDDSLKIEDDMYGMKWARGFTLQMLERHEIHHRAQLTILIRQAGLVVPGVYGPAREEWAQMGLPPQTL